jgi:hypothetical protein
MLLPSPGFDPGNVLTMTVLFPATGGKYLEKSPGNPMERISPKVTAYHHQLIELELSGGPVQTVCDAPIARGGTWNKDGVIVFTPQVRGGLYQVPASGGTPAPISDPDASRGETSHRWPMFLPDGKHYLYLAANFAGQKGVDAIFVGSLDSKEKRFVVEGSANAAYAAPGYLLFYRDKTLLAQQFDLRRFALPRVLWCRMVFRSLRSQLKMFTLNTNAFALPGWCSLSRQSRWDP